MCRTATRYRTEKMCDNAKFERQNLIKARKKIFKFGQEQIKVK